MALSGLVGRRRDEAACGRGSGGPAGQGPAMCAMSTNTFAWTAAATIQFAKVVWRDGTGATMSRRRVLVGQRPAPRAIRIIVLRTQ